MTREELEKLYEQAKYGPESALLKLITHCIELENRLESLSRRVPFGERALRRSGRIG